MSETESPWDGLPSGTEGEILFEIGEKRGVSRASERKGE